MREPEIALVFSPEAWVEGLHRYLTDHGGARVRQLVMDPALALEEEYGVLIVSHRWPGLTRNLIETVHERSRRVLGVYDLGEPAGRDYLESLGVDGVIEADASMNAFVETLRALAPVPDPPWALRSSLETTATVGATTIDAREADGSGGRRLVAVGGVSGAGSTELAIGLAAALYERGEPSTLIDADEVAPALAQRLGLPIEPNLRTAIEAVEYGMGALDEMLLRIGPGIPVLCGIPNVATWAQVRAGEVLDVIKVLARTRHQMIANVGSRMEDVGRSGQCRYGITRRVLGEASTVLGVGSPTPVAVARLLGWVGDVRQLNATAPIHLVVNRAPRDRYRRAELEREIRRTFPPASLSFVPQDQRVDAAAWSGGLVARGPFVRAVAELARTAIPETVPVTRRRSTRPRFRSPPSRPATATP